MHKPLFLLTTVLLGGALLCVSPCHADETQTATVAAVAPVNPVVAKLKAQVEATSDEQPVWDALQKNLLTPEEAWQSDLIDAQSIQMRLGQGIAYGDSQQVQAFRAALGGVLLEHAPKDVADTEALPAIVLWALADYYASQHDERAALLYNATGAKETFFFSKGWIYSALGNFYIERKMPYHAEHAFLKGRAALVGKGPQFAGELLVTIARMWTSEGNADKANEFYALAGQEESAAVKGMARLDQGNALIRQGSYAKAREMLGQPLEGSGPAEVLRIIMLCRVAGSYYKEGDFDKTRETLKVINARYAVWQKDNPQGENEFGLNGSVLQAGLFATFIEKWKEAPLVVETQGGRMVVPKDATQPLSKRISLRTFRPSKFTLKSEAPYLKASLTNGDWTGERRYYSEQEVTLEVDPTLLPAGDEDVSTNVVVTLQGERPFELRVPILISRG